MTTDILAETLERLHRWGPEFGGDANGDNGLSNHAPMTVEVLARRGFADRIGHWVDGYVPELVPLPGPHQRIDDDWRAALGDGRRIGDWVAHFTGQVTERPWREVLVQWWPRLLPGIAAGATHGVIRVGHAVRTLTDGDAGPLAATELAHGLAFWAARSRAVPGSAAPSGDLDPVRALDAVPRLPAQSGLLAERLGRLADVAGWPAAQAALRAPADADDVPTQLERLIEAATLRYLTHGHGSPVLLVHTATAPNAVLHTLPGLPRSLWVPSLAAVWSASAALVATYEPGDAALRAEPPAAPAAGDPVAEALGRSAEHGDAHVIKFTDTAVDVYERGGNPDALAAASRAAALIDPI